MICPRLPKWQTSGASEGKRGGWFVNNGEVYDFSNCQRLISLTLACERDSARIVLPQTPTMLEYLYIEHKNEGFKLTKPAVFPRLQYFNCLLSGKSTPLSSTSFPELQSLNLSSCPAGVVADLSAHRKQCMDIELRGFQGDIKLPAHFGGYLEVSGRNITSEAIKGALPTVRRLGFAARDSAGVRSLFSILNNAPQLSGQPLSSAHLRQFSLKNWGHSFEISLGAFRSLQHLALDNVDVTLVGVNFPLLETITLSKNAEVIPRGDFPCLRSIQLSAVSMKSYGAFTAPSLREMTFDTVTDAKDAFIGRATFPQLHIVTVLHSFIARHNNGRCWGLLEREFFPTFRSDEKLDQQGEAVILKLDARTPLSLESDIRRSVPHWVISRTRHVPPPLMKIGR